MEARLRTRASRVASRLARLSSRPAVHRALVIAGFLVVGWLLGGTLDAYAAEDVRVAPPVAPASLRAADSALAHPLTTAKAAVGSAVESVRDEPATGIGHALKGAVTGVTPRHEASPPARHGRPAHEPLIDLARVPDGRSTAVEVPAVEAPAVQVPSAWRVTDDIVGQLDHLDLTGGLLADALRLHLIVSPGPLASAGDWAEKPASAAASPSTRHDAARHATPREHRAPGSVGIVSDPVGQHRAGAATSPDTPPATPLLPVQGGLPTSSEVDRSGQRTAAGGVAVLSRRGILPAPLPVSAPFSGAGFDGPRLFVDDPSFSPE